MLKRAVAAAASAILFVLLVARAQIGCQPIAAPPATSASTAPSASASQRPFEVLMPASKADPHVMRQKALEERQR